MRIKMFEGFDKDDYYEEISYYDFLKETQIQHSVTWGWKGPTTEPTYAEPLVKRLDKEYDRLKSIAK